MVGLGKAVLVRPKHKTTVLSQLGFLSKLSHVPKHKTTVRSQLGLSQNRSKFEFVESETSVSQ